MNVDAMAISNSNVLELTGRHLARVNNELSVSHISQSWVGRLVAAVSDRAAVFALTKMTRVFADDAIWFKGAATEVWEENLDVRSSIALTTKKIEKLKNSLVTLRKDLLAMQQRGRVSAVVNQAIGRTVAAAVDLFDSLEELRWTLMELEANYSPRDEGWVATTPEGVAELFRRIQQEA